MIGGIIAGAAGTAKAFIGLGQYLKAKKQYESAWSKRPEFEYYVPEGMKPAVESAKNAYLGGSATRELDESKISATTSRAVRGFERSAGSGQELMAATEQAYAQEMGELNKLALADIQYRDAARQQYIQSLTAGLQMSEKEFEYNKWIPWQMQLNEIAGRKKLSMEGMYGGMSDIVQSGLAFAGSSGFGGGGGGSSSGSSGGGSAVSSQSNSFKGYQGWDKAMSDYKSQNSDAWSNAWKEKQSGGMNNAWGQAWQNYYRQ